MFKKKEKVLKYVTNCGLLSCVHEDICTQNISVLRVSCILNQDVLIKKLLHVSFKRVCQIGLLNNIYKINCIKRNVRVDFMMDCDTFQLAVKGHN